MEKEYKISSMYGSFFLHDNMPDNKRDDLQWYFNDLYRFFLYTLTSRTHSAEIISDEDQKKMIGMLKELISVKNMLEQKED